MIAYWLVATLHYGHHEINLRVPFETNQQCIEAVKQVAKTTAQIEGLSCVAKKK